jgi:hypothetical protein
MLSLNLWWRRIRAEEYGSKKHAIPGANEIVPRKPQAAVFVSNALLDGAHHHQGMATPWVTKLKTSAARKRRSRKTEPRWWRDFLNQGLVEPRQYRRPANLLHNPTVNAILERCLVI